MHSLIGHFGQIVLSIFKKEDVSRIRLRLRTLANRCSTNLPNEKCSSYEVGTSIKMAWSSGHTLRQSM